MAAVQEAMHEVGRRSSPDLSAGSTTTGDLYCEVVDLLERRCGGRGKGEKHSHKGKEGGHPPIQDPTNIGNPQ